MIYYFFCGNCVVFAYKVPDSGDVLVEHTDSYSHVVKMLETLHMAELIPKFKAAMIKVSWWNKTLIC